MIPPYDIYLSKITLDEIGVSIEKCPERKRESCMII